MLCYYKEIAKHDDVFFLSIKPYINLDFWYQLQARLIPSLVQIIACCLFITNPLSEPMLTLGQLNSEERISMYFDTKHSNSFKKISFEMLSTNFTSVQMC